MQPTHATSDMYWAEARLGPERVKGAYAWRTILNAGGRLALGSDFPVEDVNPFFGILRRRHATGSERTGPPAAGTRSSASRSPKPSAASSRSRTASDPNTIAAPSGAPGPG